MLIQTRTIRKSRKNTTPEITLNLIAVVSEEDRSEIAVFRAATPPRRTPNKPSGTRAHNSKRTIRPKNPPQAEKNSAEDCFKEDCFPSCAPASVAKRNS